MGSTPFRILQAVAGGIFGRHSRQMGWTSAAVGLLCHFTVAFGAATVYYVASRKLRVLVQHPVLCGLIYGELVFLFMYLRGYPAFCHRTCNLQPCHLHHRPGRPSIVGRITHRSLRPPLLQLTGYSGGPRWGNAVALRATRPPLHS